MLISKFYLKQIIKEEINKLSENLSKDEFDEVRVLMKAVDFLKLTATDQIIEKIKNDYKPGRLETEQLRSELSLVLSAPINGVSEVIYHEGRNSTFSLIMRDLINKNKKRPLQELKNIWESSGLKINVTIKVAQDSPTDNAYDKISIIVGETKNDVQYSLNKDNKPYMVSRKQPQSYDLRDSIKPEEWKELISKFIAQSSDIDFLKVGNDTIPFTRGSSGHSGVHEALMYVSKNWVNVFLQSFKDYVSKKYDSTLDMVPPHISKQLEPFYLNNVLSKYRFFMEQNNNSNMPEGKNQEEIKISSIANKSKFEGKDEYAKSPTVFLEKIQHENI